MNRAVALLIALPLLYTSPAQAVSQLEKEKAITVLVTNEGFLGSGSRGSGVLLDANHVLTCAHLVKSMKDEVFVYTYPLGKVVTARPQFRDVSLDLLLLILDTPVDAPKQPVVFQGTFEVGDPITVIGNALGSMKWIIAKGVIAGTERGYLMTDATVNPGNSGGPWLNARGEVVALTDFRIGMREEVGAVGLEGGISAETINEFMEKILNASDK